jgi:FMN phosphatase YigB (HAD superfamily)
MGFDILLFDFGGTLDGPGEHWLQRFDRCYRACGIAVPRTSLGAAFAESTRRCYADPGMRERDLRATIACHVAWQAESLALPGDAPVEGVIDAFVSRTRSHLETSRRLLERWASRARLGVISNFYGNVHLLLDEAGIAPLLGTIVDSTVVGVAKPDPRIFALALERLGGTPAAALYVGDAHDKDVLGARAAGLRTAWLPGDDGPGDAPHAADFVLRGLEDLDGIIG